MLFCLNPVWNLYSKLLFCLCVVALYAVSLSLLVIDIFNLLLVYAWILRIWRKRLALWQADKAATCKASPSHGHQFVPWLCSLLPVQLSVNSLGKAVGDDPSVSHGITHVGDLDKAVDIVLAYGWLLWFSGAMNQQMKDLSPCLSCQSVRVTLKHTFIHTYIYIF